MSADVHRQDRARIIHLEESESRLHAECHKLKEIADIAQHQTEAITMRHTSQGKETEALRKQLYELQMETDEKTIIGESEDILIFLKPFFVLLFHMEVFGALNPLGGTLLSSLKCFNFIMTWVLMRKTIVCFASKFLCSRYLEDQSF